MTHVTQDTDKRAFSEKKPCGELIIFGK